MTGQQLYQLYVDAHAEENIGVESWDELPTTDHGIWNRIAEQLP